MITFIRYGDLHYIAESHVPILDALRAATRSARRRRCASTSSTTRGG